MVEISDIGFKEDELELELELGLSIGGSFRKSETQKPTERESGYPFDSKTNGFNLDLREIIDTTSSSRSSSSPTVENALLDPQKKREIHALRRQEAKKKQREKRNRRGRNSLLPSVLDHSSEEEHSRATKREKKTEPVNGSESNINGDSKKITANLNSSKGGSQTLPCNLVQEAAGQQQYPYAPLPYTNGFAYPCMVPCWSTPPGAGGNEKNVFQPVACRGFRPFLAHQSLGLNLSNGFDPKMMNGGIKHGEIRKTTSNGSPMCSSSSVSDHRSTSQEADGSSTDTKTNSSHSSPEQKNGKKVSKPNDPNKAYSEVRSALPRHNELARAQIDHEDNLSQSLPAGSTKEPVHLVPKLKRPTSTTHHQNSSPANYNDSSKETMNMDMGAKPPRPQAQNRNGTPPPPGPQMPYVSTRGNGPNGKTVTGFLYRYTKSEVSIVCVCHGSTLSPAEFVEHAGGTDVSHPLKHITVIPSAFG